MEPFSFSDLEAHAPQAMRHLVSADEHPLNLALSLAGAVGRLCWELGQIAPEQMAEAMTDPERLDQLSEAVADVQILLQALASEIGLKLGPATEQRLRFLGTS